MSLYIDLTEFLAKPTATGIQRVTGELCKHLPEGAAIPVRLDSNRYIALSPLLIEAVGNYFENRSESSAAEIGRLGAIENGSGIRVSEGDSVLVPEVFVDPQRLTFFRSMDERELRSYRFFVYDFIPSTHPEYFPPEFVSAWHGYVHLIRRAPYCGFISEHTRDIYYGRLKRTIERGGVVLPLGCDCFGPRARLPAVNRPLVFTVLGTIEPRKNHALILDAFEPLLRQIKELSLSFIGKMGWVDSCFARKLHVLASDKHSGFSLHAVSTDEAIRNSIEQSCATIYLSPAEGYGLPPVESLWCGTPVIASTAIPSLQRLGAAGIHYVEPLTILNLRSAVLAFVDTAYANQKVEETMQLGLPTWQSFVEAVLSWCGTR